MKNIHLLPTDKPSRLISSGKEFNLLKNLTTDKRCKNIYITSDEEIKEGDWVYYKNGDLKGIHKIVNSQSPKTMILKKIILTTDQELIADSVQAMDDEFLQWFVKNPSCEKVEIKMENYYASGALQHNLWRPKIIIPKEETKQESVFSQLEVGKEYEQEMFELGEEPK